MTNQPTISVIIPVGPNHDQYLPIAKQSVLDQSLPAEMIETIVIHDRSGQGAGWARNQGLSQASAPLITWLDADDYLTPGALEAMLIWYAKEDAAYIYGDWWDKWSETDTKYRLSANYSQEAHFKAGLHVITTMMAKDDILSVGGFSNLKGWEDWDWWCRCAINGLCGVRVPYPVLVYCIERGYRRNHSYEIGNDLLDEHYRRYGDYISGKMKPMACNCGNKKAKEAAKVALAQLGRGLVMTDQTTGYVRMEYLGTHSGPKTYRNPSTGNAYQGARNVVDQFKNVAAADVHFLTRTGMWRAVPRIPDGSNPPPAPVPHLILDEGSLTQSEAPGGPYSVPMEGVPSPAPVVQFAPPPDQSDFNSLDEALEGYPQYQGLPIIPAGENVADHEGTEGEPGGMTLDQLPPPDPNAFDPELLNRPGRPRRAKQ